MSGFHFTALSFHFVFVLNQLSFTARRRERFLKSGRARDELKKILPQQNP